MAMFPKLKDWITLRDNGLLGAVKRRQQERKETMLQLFGAEGNNAVPNTAAPAQTSPSETTRTETPADRIRREAAEVEAEIERQRRLRKKYGISND